ncbi:unnamed protein product [Rotaria sp. Silwood1]|nr:unnamed protein product [Rotaria sp. Silwood1]
MNQTSVLTLLHLCLSKEQRLNHDINIILFECQRLVRRHCRHSNLQNKLIITLFTLVDNSAEINRPRLGYRMYIGVLDGTHVVMLAVINSDLQFTYINIGASDRCNDSSVYNRSNLSEVIQHSIYQDNYMVVNNIKIQCHLIADSAFALDRTLMKPIPERPDMPRHNIIFNYRLSDVGGPSNELSVY